MELILPPELSERLAGYECERNTIGMSTTSVYKFYKNDETHYLKVDKNFGKIARERDVLNWLQSKVPVPQVVYYAELEQTAYLLETAMPGVGGHENMIDKATVRILADGLLQLQAVDISACPFNHSLEIELQEALFNIQNDLVDMDDFEENSPYDTPMELYEWLCNNKVEDEPYFVHGDYCLPNVLIHDDKCGFIDIGNAGIADKWEDIAMCVRSLGYNLYLQKQDGKKNELVDYLFECLGIEPDWQKIDYYIKLDELF
ncbi:MAG: aminoglycoside 3'-phosphotransferase [Oscillospiraceae bacterium]|nr:aminoglycoside 3'-phosphotransferase [Oscillospiraceae bacterium]